MWLAAGWPTPRRAWWPPARRARSSRASARGCSPSTSCPRVSTSCSSAWMATVTPCSRPTPATSSPESGGVCATWRRCSPRPRAGSWPTRSGCSTGTAATASARTAGRRAWRGRPGTCACVRCAAHSTIPRTDPVVIMLVTDGDRALLGRQAQWPTGRYSALAGFVEPGESLEEAVAREVREEAGVTVAGVRYRSSQPWPFPSSLMLGFSARWAGGDPAVRDDELEDVGWFAREAIVGGDVLLPPPTAIARRLIDEWLGDDEAPDAAGGLAVSPTSSIFSKTRPAGVAFSSASPTVAPAVSFVASQPSWVCRPRGRCRRPGHRHGGRRRRPGRGGRSRGRCWSSRLVAVAVVGRARRGGSSWSARTCTRTRCRRRPCPSRHRR